MKRDLVGYGPHPPKIAWPGGARIALSIVVNYEEGSEFSPELGDDRHELSGDIRSSRPAAERDRQTETQWEYGARAGVWRLLRLFERYAVPTTFFVCAMALERNPELGRAIVAQGHDVWGHGYRWIPQWHLRRDEEREYIRAAVESIRQTTGVRPLGWFTKGGPSASTREILAEEGFLYDSDELNDDLPYYTRVAGRPWLIVPYAFDTNDGKYWRDGWSNAGEFFEYLKDAFDVLYEEGATFPKMLSVGLHSKVSGRPGRARAVERFIQYVQGRPDVWIARRDAIARWWLDHYPPADGGQ